jgi:hypothetical protein
MDQKKVALRKRTQIAMANKMMFLWVAGASVIFGFALVISIFLFQMLSYNEKVIAKKDQTIYNLKADLTNISELESKIRALDANESLLALKAHPDDNAIQVILDALPSDVNSSALGASVQDKLLSGINGLRILSLQVDPVPGIESTTNNNAVYDASTASSVSEYVITFHFSVIGSEAALKKVLTNLEASIRTIDIMTLKIEGTNSDDSIMTVNARAFYEPSRILELTEVTVAQ